MLNITVFSVCASISLTICFFIIETRDLKEKIVVFVVMAIIPSFIAACSYDAASVTETWAAVRGFVAPWVGFVYWQLKKKRETGKNYDKILETEEGKNSEISEASRGQDFTAAG